MHHESMIVIIIVICDEILDTGKSGHRHRALYKHNDDIVLMQ